AADASVEGALEAFLAARVDVDEAQHLRAERAVRIEAARLGDRPRAGQRESLQLLALARLGVPLEPHERLPACESAPDVGIAQAPRLRQLVHGGRVLRPLRRPHVQRWYAERARQKLALTIQNLAALSGERDLLPVLPRRLADEVRATQHREIDRPHREEP